CASSSSPGRPGRTQKPATLRCFPLFLLLSGGSRTIHGGPEAQILDREVRFQAAPEGKTHECRIVLRVGSRRCSSRTVKLSVHPAPVPGLPCDEDRIEVLNPLPYHPMEIEDAI